MSNETMKAYDAMLRNVYGDAAVDRAAAEGAARDEAKATSAHPPFQIHFDVGYGSELRTGWTLVVDGAVKVELASLDDVMAALPPGVLDVLHSGIIGAMIDAEMRRP